MATWEDGPEYAPHERPQYFADAPVPPLEQAPAVAPAAVGLPTTRPSFDEPTVPVAPLATLVPAPPDERDPGRPFDVVTASLTSESGWGSTGQRFVATAPFVPSAAARTATPAVGAPWPAPDRAALDPRTAEPPPARQPDPYAAYPAPGTPEWFAPPPATYGDERRPGRVDAKQVVEAATPGLCICLAVGGLIYVLAPVMLVLAVFLSTRVRVAQRPVRVAFRSAAGAVGFFAVVGLFRSVLTGNPWWGFVAGWSAGICWAMLVLLLLVVWQTLARPRPPEPPTPNPWG